MEILHWQIEPKLKKLVSENYRTNFAKKLKDRDVLTLVRELTFDGVAPEISISNIKKLFDYVEGKFLEKSFSGIGVEVGAGTAVFSAILANKKLVSRMYAVEICDEVANLLMPKVVSQILKKDSNKVVGCIGNFDKMELKDESVDFIFDFFSFHHSDNLDLTFSECYRVLKKGGFVLCLDKARPNHLTDKDLKGMLDKEYNNEFKRHFGIPIKKKLTRRMNGEREYGLRDWQKAFQKSGFSRVKHFRLTRCSSNNLLFRIIKCGLSYFSPGVQIFLNRFLPRPKIKRQFDIARENIVYSKEISHLPKEISLLIAYK